NVITTPGCRSSTDPVSILAKARGCWCGGGSSIPSTTSRYRRRSMAVSEAYRRQVMLLVRTIPFVATETCFALKGGTAINLFVRDMPRFSVDIDLTYLPVEDRASSLVTIDAALRRIAGKVRTSIPGARVTS